MQMPHYVPALLHIPCCCIAALEMPSCGFLGFASAVHFTEGNQNTIPQTLSNIHNKIWVQTSADKTLLHMVVTEVFPLIAGKVCT